ncbi:hypothetical protein GW17_00047571 [Ensete ventricosum]|nr:hypothetical protein GW17_00047571 [Ensete ventricosum]
MTTGGWGLVMHNSDDVAHVRPTRYARLIADQLRKLLEEWSGATTSSDHGGDLAHMGDLILVIRHPTLRDNPNITNLMSRAVPSALGSHVV